MVVYYFEPRSVAFCPKKLNIAEWSSIEHYYTEQELIDQGSFKNWINLNEFKHGYPIQFHSALLNEVLMIIKM